MATVNEALSNQSPLEADLKAGIEAIGQQQVIRFTRYIRLVLPLDGYVFWVRADLISRSALLNVARINDTQGGFNQAPKPISGAPFVDAKGSLHYASSTQQDEAEGFTINRVVFTSEVEVDAFNEINSQLLLIAEFDGIRFAFSSRGKLYKPQAGVYHYEGAAIYADMDTQIIDDVASLDARQVVSNSLPIWLSLSHYSSPFSTLPVGSLALYPSFLIPGNLVPPFVAVHIEPASTQAIQAAPLLGPDMSHYQLVQERVRLTFWGLRNEDVLNFLDLVNQFTLDTDVMGIMNMPVPRDEKRIQTELNTIAQKKVIEYDVNYYQTTSRQLARELIREATIHIIVPGYVPPTPPQHIPGMAFNNFANSSYLPMIIGALGAGSGAQAPSMAFNDSNNSSYLSIITGV